MRITTKYDLGQRVWIVLSHYDDVPCPACEGKGRLPGADGKTYECGNCDGSGDVEKEIARVHPVTIDFIQTATRRTTSTVKYGIAEQAIGLFDEDGFFETEAVAQAEADKRNAGGE